MDLQLKIFEERRSSKLRCNTDAKGAFNENKLKSLKVAKSKDDDGGAVDGSVDAVDVNGVLMLCMMVHVMVCVSCGVGCG